ncbi:PAS domain S-box protein [Chloracidobacterium thermophilum]|uniref:PAS domain-containing protein n=1 Tax=Chloracidobacterium thermophilum TaxID=458033 RepID=UPI00073890D3|nr:PAS domain S-box protein [Chloracidobacterium thermophilum]
MMDEAGTATGFEGGREPLPAGDMALAAAQQRIAQLEAALQEAGRTIQALRESELRYREIFDGASDIILVLGLDGRRLAWSPAGERILGYSAEEIQAMSVREFSHLVVPEHRERVRRALRDKTEDGVVESHYEADFTAKDGRRVTLEVNSRLLFRDGRPVAIQGILRDITNRKRIEQALRESEARYRDLFENANDIVYVHDFEGRFLSINRKVEQVLGYTPADARHLTLTHIVTPEHRARALQSIADKRAGKTETTQYELDVIAKNGQRVTLEISSRLFYENGVPVGIHGTARDVTRRRQMEKALRESEARYRTLFDSAQDVIYCHDLQGHVLDINPAAERLFGYRRDEARSINVVDLLLPASRSVALDAIKPLLDGTETTVRYEATLLARDGRRITLEMITWLVLENGTPVAFQGIGRDLTERRLSERALRESEERFRRIFDAAPLGIVLVSLTGQILRANRAVCEWLGYAPEEIVGRPHTDFIPPEDTEESMRLARRLVEDAKLSSFQAERRYLTKHGQVVWGRLTVVALRNGEEQPQYLLGMIEDITQQRLLEEQVRHAQKMEAVGQLAAGIAHEFNNLLTVVAGYAGLLERRLAPTSVERSSPDLLHRYARDILTAVSRASVLTGQLLAFGRKQPQQLVPLNLNELVLDAVRMLRPLLEPHITLVTDLSPDLGIVVADRQQLEQVLTNLAVNARDAMPKGGTLTLMTLNVWHEARPETRSRAMFRRKAVRDETMQMHPYVMLAVSDTGMGMSEEVRQRIFEPFFTTKPVGKGTGLGLSVVEGIIAQNKGFITVESEVGKGTTFRIFLPRGELLQAAPAGS